MNPIPMDIKPRGRGHDRASFDCGEPALDEFFRRHARRNQERNISRTYLATEQGGNRVLGYYTLAAGDSPPVTSPSPSVVVCRATRSRR
jgi:hypothetical protein